VERASAGSSDTFFERVKKASELARLHTPDNVLLRRFGIVRAVGGLTYIAAVVVLFGIFGWAVWPLALGVPVLAVVTTAYFFKSAQYPRLAVAVSLVADASVLGGAIAFFGGTGSGLVMLYSIVVVSAGILLGPGAAAGFTVFTAFLGVLQIIMEEIAFPPALLHRPDLDERIPILLVSLAGLASIGYLAANYASRLHDLIAEAGAEFEAARHRRSRRRTFVEHAWADVQAPLVDVEAVAEVLDTAAGDLDEEQRRTLAARLRMSATQLDAEAAQLFELGVLDTIEDTRPKPVHLRRVVDDCVVALGGRLHDHVLEVDVPKLKVVGHRRAARRVVLNLLENIVEHTPPGTTARITAVASAGQGVLVVTDDGPGIPPEAAGRLFDASGTGTPRVGLPLVAELCQAMGAQIRYEPAAGGGSRFMVGFKLAPTGAPDPDD
jgi:two-component system, OmpR family, sensor kinase